MDARMKSGLMECDTTRMAYIYYIHICSEVYRLRDRRNQRTWTLGKGPLPLLHRCGPIEGLLPLNESLQNSNIISRNQRLNRGQII